MTYYYNGSEEWVKTALKDFTPTTSADKACVVIHRSRERVHKGLHIFLLDDFGDGDDADPQSITTWIKLLKYSEAQAQQTLLSDAVKTLFNNANKFTELIHTTKRRTERLMKHFIESRGFPIAATVDTTKPVVFVLKTDNANWSVPGIYIERDKAKFDALDRSKKYTKIDLIDSSQISNVVRTSIVVTNNGDRGTTLPKYPIIDLSTETGLDASRLKKLISDAMETWNASNAKDALNVIKTLCGEIDTNAFVKQLAA